MEQAPEPRIRDGQHDFDFEFGNWDVHHRRLRRPLHGSDDWYEFHGAASARALWGGLANIDEIEFENPTGRIQGMTIRFYDPETGEWSLYWGTSKNGLTIAPNVGSFNEAGVGEFFNRELFDGVPIICRYRWSEIERNRCRWDQAFSTDDGGTWETNWIMGFTRL